MIVEFNDIKECKTYSLTLIKSVTLIIFTEIFVGLIASAIKRMKSKLLGGKQ